MAAKFILPFEVWPEGILQARFPANNNALRAEILAGLVISKATTAQPASPADGDIYIIPAGATGAQWSLLDADDLAIFKGGSWYGFAPVPGVVVNFDGSQEQYAEGSGGWVELSGSGAGGTWGSITGTLSAQTDLQAALDAKATTAYVDNALQGLSWKRAVRAASTANSTLATAYENGDAIDGVTLVTGDRILLKNQTTASENGIYTVNASGAPTRATDADTGAEMVNATVYVSEGTTLADTQWTQTANAPITIGSTSLAFAQLSGGTGFANPMTTAGDIITGGASGAPQRLAATTNGWVLTLVSGAPAWAAVAGGSIAGFTAALNTTGTNASTNASSLTASGGTTNQNAVVSPKGTGALLSSLPDGTSTGGNLRGTDAVDLQRVRSASTQVANGPGAVLIGGSSNTASGGNASVVGGSDNVASGTASFAGGQSSTASATGAVALGSTAQATANQAIALGRQVTAEGVVSFAIGDNARARVRGSLAHAAGRVAAIGDCQVERQVHRRVTTNNTPTALSTDGTAPGATTCALLPDNAVYAFEITVVGKVSTFGDRGSWKITGQIARGANAAATVIDGTPTVTTIATVGGASAWAVAVSANTTLGSVEVTATGAASTTILWVANLTLTEVVG